MLSLEGAHLGQYEVIEKIAKGGMATVYRARQASMNRDVAIKILPSNFTHEDSFLERFYREVEIIAQLQHPHILPVYDFGEYEQLPYIVMALIKGGTLADRISAGKVSTQDTLKIVQQIASALDYAHSKGIIHRDFKPANVLLDESGNTYLADFGLSKITESASDLTGATIIGTPTYMAPEQAGSEGLTPAVDVYALGVTIFQMLSGQAPYEASSGPATIMAHMMQPIPDIRVNRPDLPDAVQQVIKVSLAKESPDRYQRAGELAEELQAAFNVSQSDPSGQPSAEALSALIMTNMLGRVIFVDNQCLRILKRHQHEARHIIGKPIHEVLGLDANMSEDLLSAIGEQGSVEAFDLNIMDSQSQARFVRMYGVATRDEDGKFVGADLTIEVIPDVGEFDSERFSAVNKAEDTREEDYLQTYFRSQLEALYQLMLTWGGKKLAHNLEEIINETGERNVWPVSMQSGHITLQLKRSDTDIYRALLARSLSYSAGVIGNKYVKKELDRVNKQTHPAIINFIQKIELDHLFEEILD